MCDPLFEIAVSDLKDFMPQIKKQLLDRDEKMQISAAERILAILESSENELERNVAIIELIESDVVSNVCDALQTSGNKFRMIALKCLSIIGESRKFYENHAATETVDALLKAAHFMIDSKSENESIFQFILRAIWEILQRMIKAFGMDMDSVCDPHQLLMFLKNLDPWDRPVLDTVKFMSVRLLNVLLHEDTLDIPEDALTILELSRKGLATMMDIAKACNDDERKAWYVAAISTSTCCFGARFIASEENHSRITWESRMLFGEAILMTVTDLLIPIVKLVNMEDGEFDEMRANFVTCLFYLFSIDGLDHKELSKCLTTEGYLLYLLHLIPRFRGLRHNICKVLSEALTHLASACLFLETWPGSPKRFTEIMYKGLCLLPQNPEHWRENVPRSHQHDATAYMTIIYFTCLNSERCETVPLGALIEKISMISDLESLPAAILKPLWFLFALSALEHGSPNSEENYDVAVNKLMLILENSEIVHSYTHHISLLRHCLHSTEISKDIRFKVINLWLIESKGNIKPLLQLNCNVVIRHSLLDILQKGYPEEALWLSVKAIQEMITLGNTREISENLWNIMPNILSCTNAKVPHVKAVLELANALPMVELPLHVITRCTDGLLRIILKRGIDSNLKNLIVKQAYAMYRVAADRKYFKICQKFVNNIQVTKELYNCVLSTRLEEEQELMSSSLDLLTLIVQSSFKYSHEFRCTKFLEVDLEDLRELLMRSRKYLCVSISGTRFLYEVLHGANEKTMAILKRSTSREIEVDKVIKLYETLFLIYYFTTEIGWNNIHRCLLELLNFSQKNARLAMYRLCTLPSNYDYIASVIAKGKPSSFFHDYLVTWLRYKKFYCTEYRSQKRGFFHTRFHETIDIIVKYIGFLGEVDQLEDSKRLNDAVSPFCGL